MDAIDKAREMGAEHGREAAEEWFDSANGWRQKLALLALDRQPPFEDGMSSLPEPDLSGEGNTPTICDLTADEGREDWSWGEIIDVEHIYEEAFREARDATIRARCEP